MVHSATYCRKADKWVSNLRKKDCIQLKTGYPNRRFLPRVWTECHKHNHTAAPPHNNDHNDAPNFPLPLLAFQLSEPGRRHFLVSRMVKTTEQRFWLTFGRPLVQILAKPPTILIEVFDGFLGSSRRLSG
jgi:hypothetical protein